MSWIKEGELTLIEKISANILKVGEICMLQGDCLF